MYSKLFSSIINSSVWSEDSDICKVWVTLLAMQDQGGCVFGSVSGLARICNIPVEKVQAALEKFVSPDPLSSDLTRAPEREGRRIVVIDGGWKLLNADHYGQLRTSDDRRLQVKEAVRRHRDKLRKRKSRVIKSNPSDVDSDSDSDSDKTRKDKKEKTPSGSGPAWGLCRYFTHCKMPTGPTKKAAFEELMRQGVTYEAIKASGQDIANRGGWDFFDHIRALKPPPKVAGGKPILKTPF